MAGLDVNVGRALLSFDCSYDLEVSPLPNLNLSCLQLSDKLCSTTVLLEDL